MTAFIGDGKALYKEGMRLGIPLPKIREMVNIETMLAGKKPDSYTLAPGAARYGAGGAEIARNPAAVKDYRTSEQQNVSGFLERNPGATEADYFKMKRSPGVTVDARSMGTIPTDHRVKYDAQGRPERYEVIEGSPTARKMAAAAEKASGRAGDKSAQASLVDTHVDRIRKKVGEGAGPFGLIPVTGMAGAAMEDIPGTKSHDVSKLVDSLKANIGFNTLNRMRQNSPTGGALGQCQRARAGLSPVDNRELGAEPRRGTILGKPRAGAERIQPRDSRHQARRRTACPLHWWESRSAEPDTSRRLRTPRAGHSAGKPEPRRRVRPDEHEADLDGLNLANMNVEALDQLWSPRTGARKAGCWPATIRWLRGFGNAGSARADRSRAGAAVWQSIDAGHFAASADGPCRSAGRSRAGTGTGDPRRGTSAYPAQSARMAAISASQAPSFKTEMDRAARRNMKRETANNWQFPDQAEPGTGRPPRDHARGTGHLARDAHQDPLAVSHRRPSDTGSPVGMPRTLGEYGIETSRNLPGSLGESLGQGAMGCCAKSGRDR